MNLLFVLLNVFNLTQIANTEQLITEMNSRYAGKFNKNITFIQLNTHFNEDGSTESSTWYEAFHFPGKYRIDYGYTPNVDGIIFADDSVYHFKDKMLTKKGQSINDILLLCGDIYFLTPKQSLDKIKKLGYNTSEFREDVWEGRPVFVVGAKKGDEVTAQFWIDKENLYLVRNINVSKETAELEDAHFVEHEIVGKAWVENKVIVFSKGRKIRMEKYAEVMPDRKLNAEVFDHKKWGQLHWHDKKK